VASKTDETFDRDEDGHFMDQDKIEFMKMLAKQCPTRLLSRRIFS